MRHLRKPLATAALGNASRQVGHELAMQKELVTRHASVLNGHFCLSSGKVGTGERARKRAEENVAVAGKMLG